MNTCDTDFRKTRDEARYLKYSVHEFKKERSKSNYYFNNQQNISQSNGYSDIIKNDNHHVNSYTQSQNIFVREDNDNIVKHSSFAARETPLVSKFRKSKTARHKNSGTKKKCWKLGLLAE